MELMVDPTVRKLHKPLWTVNASAFPESGDADLVASSGALPVEVFVGENS
jgi:hypothetical protein